MARAALDKIDPDTQLTTHEAGELIQMNPSSINKWVKEKRIAAYRTPGGHRRIRADDFVAFLTKHQMPVPKKLEHVQAADPPTEPKLETKPKTIKQGKGRR